MTKHFWARQTQVKRIWFQRRREGKAERCGLNIKKGFLFVFVLNIFIIVNENIPTDNDRTFLGASYTNKTYNYGFRGGGSEREALYFFYFFYFIFFKPLKKIYQQIMTAFLGRVKHKQNL